jgi:hypothetical protein
MADVSEMSSQGRIEEAIRRSLPRLGPEAREQVLAMLSPASLVIVSATLVAWAGSHAFGVGEIVDIVLLVVGFSLLGWSVLEGARELVAFAETALKATNDSQIDVAAEHFARAIAILGISTVSAILLHRGASAAVRRGAPAFRSLPDVGPPPAPGAPLKIARPIRLPSGALGETDWWGNISVTRGQVLKEQRLTLYHEWVHRVLSPRLAPLRQLRARVRASLYWRSSLLRYLEETMAESYAQLRVSGVRGLITGISFPIQGGYVTISQLATEGMCIGSIFVGGARFSVYVVLKPWREER